MTPQSYGDLTDLNSSRLILDSVGRQTLREVAANYIDQLNTSTAVYERNGDYALGIFTGGWCRLLDEASRKLCDTDDNREALASGKWLCHESCWTDGARAAIETGRPFDSVCHGGLRIYSLPILTNEKVVGAINFGYGSPPTETTELEEIARRFGLDPRTVKNEAARYDSPARPETIEAAKKNLAISAKLIGALVESRQAEEAVRQRERLFRRTVETNPAGMSIVDATGRITLANRRAEEILGLEKSTIRNRLYNDPTWRITDFEGRPFPEENLPFNLVKRTGEPVFDVRHAIEWPDGRRVYLSINGSPLLDDRGRFQGMVSSIDDVSRRHLDHLALEQSESFFRELFNNMSSGVAVYQATDDGRDFIIKDLNRAGLESGKKRKEDIAGRKVREVFPGVEELGLFDVFKRVWKTGRPEHHPSSVYKDDQLTLWVENYVFKLPGGEVAAVYEDTTARHQAETALAAAEEKYRAIVESSPYGIQITDLEGRIVFSNPAHHRLQGYEDDSLIGKYIWELAADEKQADWTRDFIKRIVTSASPAETVYNRDLTKDGRLIDVRIDWDYLRNDRGSLIGVLSIVTDITEQKRAETALRESKALLDATGRMARVGGWALDAGSGDATWTDETYRLHEIQPGLVPPLDEEINFFHADDRERLSQAVKSALEHGEAYDLELRFVTAKGKELWTRATCSPQLEEGKIVKLVGTLQDITGLKQTELALTTEKERFESLVENAPFAVSLLDDRNRYEYVNRKFIELFGYRPDEIPDGRAWLERAFPDRRRRMEAARFWQEDIAGIGLGETIPRTFPVACRDGAEKSIVFRPVKLPDGKRLVIYQDITEQLKAEEALKTSHNRFLTVLNSIDATIYVADLESHRILFMNRYMIEAFGRDMTGEICWRVFRGEGGPCPHCTNDQLVDDEGNPTDVCVWQGRNPVTGRWYINYDRAVEWADGRLVRLQIATDITELKRMEEELRQAQKMEAIGTLASGIAHDFNNILAVIMGYSELATIDLPKDGAAAANLKEITKAASKAKDLVRRILTFSRKTEVGMAILDINNSVKEAASLMERTIPKMIDLRLDLGNDLGQVKGDGRQIEQVLMNLGTNAADAMPDGGSLTIATRRVAARNQTCQICGEEFSGDFILITVTDTGSGISPENQNRMFDPFFTTKEVGQGTGLGLSMVYGIVTAHGGHLNCHSRLEEGTSFRIYLPVTDIEPETEAVRMTDAKKPFKGNETVLVVDDESSIRNLVDQILSRYGYRTILASCGEEALELHHQKGGEIDLIILDLGMPGMGGKKCLSELRRVDSQVKVLVGSGYFQNENDPELTKMGAAGFIAKPYLSKELLSSVRAVLDE